MISAHRNVFTVQLSLSGGLCCGYEMLLYVAKHRTVLFRALKHPLFVYIWQEVGKLPRLGGWDVRGQGAVISKGHRQVTKHQC